MEIEQSCQFTRVLRAFTTLAFASAATSHLFGLGALTPFRWAAKVSNLSAAAAVVFDLSTTGVALTELASWPFPCTMIVKQGEDRPKGNHSWQWSNLFYFAPLARFAISHLRPESLVMGDLLYQTTFLPLLISAWGVPESASDRRSSIAAAALVCAVHGLGSPYLSLPGQQFTRHLLGLGLMTRYAYINGNLAAAAWRAPVQ